MQRHGGRPKACSGWQEAGEVPDASHADGQLSEFEGVSLTRMCPNAWNNSVALSWVAPSSVFRG